MSMTESSILRSFVEEDGETGGRPRKKAGEALRGVGKAISLLIGSERRGREKSPRISDEHSPPSY
jgi:hypothetical protein